MSTTGRASRGTPSAPPGPRSRRARAAIRSARSGSAATWWRRAPAACSRRSRPGRRKRDLGRRGGHRPVQVVRRHHAVDEADRERLGGSEPPAADEQLAGGRGRRRAARRARSWPGSAPGRASVKPNVAASTEIATSAQATSPAPPPSAWPLTRAITGLGQESMLENIAAAALASATFCSTAEVAAGSHPLHVGAGQNAPPAPVSTSALESSAASVAKSWSARRSGPGRWRSAHRAG